MINSYGSYTQYKAGDVVRYNGNVFQALQATYRNTPPGSVTNNTYWKYIAPLGKIFFVNRGQYSNSTIYNKLDVVTLNGKRYMAKQSTQYNSPTNDTNGTYWQLIANSGNYIPTLDNNGILI